MSDKEVVTFNISKDEDFSNWYNTICAQAELVDLRYNVKGFVVYPQWSTLAMKLMFNVYEEELMKRGHQPVIFPVVIPESNFQIEADHVEGFTPEVFWITEAGGSKLEERLAMRPTSETAMYPIYSLWIDSYRDLPLKLYQTGPVFRYEGKSTRPFIRGREFHWIEAHDVFATRDEAMDQVDEDMDISKTVISGKFGIEFLNFERPQWDKFAGAEYTYAADTLMPNGRFLQLPSTHLLGDRFAKAFNIKYLDEDRTNKYAFQTCYGPGISRIFGALISIHGDDEGLIFPWDIAPLQIVIIPILSKNKQGIVLEYSNKLLKKLKSVNIRCKLDDSDKRPGEKYYHWEMKGVPLRFEIGSNEVENETVTVFRRDTRSKMRVKLNKLLDKTIEIGNSVSQILFERSREAFKNRIQDAENLDELKQIIDDQNAARIPFCTIDLDGEECALTIKERLVAGVRGREITDEDVPEGKVCLICEKEARVFVVVGKQY